eukprot:COSAG03_NODE_10351_length_656_cov_0.669659_1_plen_50_part_01
MLASLQAPLTTIVEVNLLPAAMSDPVADSIAAIDRMAAYCMQKATLDSAV